MFASGCVHRALYGSYGNLLASYGVCGPDPHSKREFVPFQVCDYVSGDYLRVCVYMHM